MEEGILKEKWAKFHERARLFRHVPFVDFVIASGSMATGTARPDSDFDVIVGIKSGRIFTARFLSVMFFEAFGWRATHPLREASSFAKASEDETEGEVSSSKDKICLNHFVTRDSYLLSPPYNSYWKRLYESLIPLVGREDSVKEFFDKNNWLDYEKVKDKHKSAKPIVASSSRIMFNILLSGRFGDLVEKILKDLQVNKIEDSVSKAAGHKPRIIYSDKELEFHPDTYRIEEYVKNSVG